MTSQLPTRFSFSASAATISSLSICKVVPSFPVSPVWMCAFFVLKYGLFVFERLISLSFPFCVRLAEVFEVVSHTIFVLLNIRTRLVSSRRASRLCVSISLGGSGLLVLSIRPRCRRAGGGLGFWITSVSPEYSKMAENANTSSARCPKAIKACCEWVCLFSARWSAYLVAQRAKYLRVGQELSDQRLVGASMCSSIENRVLEHPHL
jgi:hypothetical protein